MINAAEYKVGAVLGAVGARLERGETKPPPHYTEQTLMDDMLAAHKFATTDEDRRLLKEIAGIGTARTRGVVIEGFVKRSFFSRVKKGKVHELRITPEGKAVLAALPDEIKSVTLTAKWERALAMVADGSAQPEQLKGKITEMLRGMVPALLNGVKH